MNAGVSGETSAGALRRVDWLLRQPVAVLVLETGANDGLRGQDPAATRESIQAILDEVRRQQPPPKVLIAGAVVGCAVVRALESTVALVVAAPALLWLVPRSGARILLPLVARGHRFGLPTR